MGKYASLAHLGQQLDCDNDFDDDDHHHDADADDDDGGGDACDDILVFSYSCFAKRGTSHN